MTPEKMLQSIAELTNRWHAQDLGRVKPAADKVLSLTTARAEADPEEFFFQGNWIYFDDATDGYCYVRFGDKDATRWKMGPGSGLQNIDYERVFIDHPAQTGKQVSFKWGLNVGISPPNIVGNINAIDSITQAVTTEHALLRAVRAGTAYVMNDRASAVAGEYGGVALVNQSTTENLIVVKVQASYISASHAVALRVSTEAGIETTASAVAFGKNLGLSGADSVAGEIWTGTDPSGTGFGTECSRGHVNSNSGPHDFLTDGGAILVPPNYALSVSAQSVNSVLGTNFIWFEESI